MEKDDGLWRRMVVCGGKGWWFVEKDGGLWRIMVVCLTWPDLLKMQTPVDVPVGH